MKTVRFLGMDTFKRKGCSVCGKSRLLSSPSKAKTINLPSGIRRTFTTNELVRVSDGDADFLVNYVRNGDKPAFEVV